MGVYTTLAEVLGQGYMGVFTFVTDVLHNGHMGVFTIEAEVRRHGHMGVFTIQAVVLRHGHIRVFTFVAEVLHHGHMGVFTFVAEILHHSHMGVFLRCLCCLPPHAADEDSSTAHPHSQQPKPQHAPTLYTKHHCVDGRAETPRGQPQYTENGDWNRQVVLSITA